MLPSEDVPCHVMRHAELRTWITDKFDIFSFLTYDLVILNTELKLISFF